MKFKLDHEGAKVEDEAFMSFCFNSYTPMDTNVKKRYFYLNKPFWVLTKESKSDEYYMILKIENDYFMKEI